MRLGFVFLLLISLFVVSCTPRTPSIYSEFDYVPVQDAALPVDTSADKPDTFIPPDAAADSGGQEDTLLADDSDALIPADEDIVEQPEGEFEIPDGYYVLITEPKAQISVVGESIAIGGITNCSPANVTLVLNDTKIIYEGQVAAGHFSTEYVFKLEDAGIDRKITAAVKSEKCFASNGEFILVQKPFAMEQTTVKIIDTYDVWYVRFPTGTLTYDITVVGSELRHTVKDWADAYVDKSPKVLVNSGYFREDPLDDPPFSYSRGIFGWESPAVNQNGPRACFIWNRETRRGTFETSFGRDSVTKEPLYPAELDIACAGPMLLAAGQYVIETSFFDEHFNEDPLQSNESYPRTGICTTDDLSVVLLMAWRTAGVAGPSLGELAYIMRKFNCMEGMSLSLYPSAMWFDGDYHYGFHDTMTPDALMVYRAK